jgi:nucleolar protein 58
LKDFQKFDSAATALEEVAAVVEGKVTPRLTSLLNSIKDEKKVSLAVADPKLGNAIGKIPGLEIKAIADSTTQDLYRAIRNHLPSLIPGLLPDDVNTMSLGLSHSLARHKLKFSPDKIDTMIVQAIALLDDLDKELNTYAMRVKEWYGWHFPEMAKILNDNLAYAKVVLKMGMRTNWESCDLAEILPEEIETAVKSAADRSMGTEITQEDLDNIQLLAEQVISFTEYRQQLASYLSARMTAIAPNLTALVGELVGARLIAHAGSLMNLSKSPASTIQILGAEKALFRALKTKHDTPKYGLIYHASLIGQASGRNKGKMARVLAAKAAIGLRVDALQDWGEHEEDIPEDEKAALGLEARFNLERKLAAMEGKPLKPRGVAIAPNGVSTQPKKWEIKEARKYNPDADALTGEEAPAIEAAPLASKKGKKDKKKKMIEEVKEVKDATPKSETEEDERMVDVAVAENGISAESQSQPDSPVDEQEAAVIVPPATNGSAAAEADSASQASHTDTIPTPSDDTPPSPDSPTQQERNWQSSILGNTKEAKKARKVERHERKLAMSAEKSRERKVVKEKLARRLDRKERREAKAAQVDKREKKNEERYLEPAMKAGLSVTRYKRKLERGEIRFEADATPVAVSKKEIKKMRKAAEKQAVKQKESGDVNGTKKRKRTGEDDTDVVSKLEKKKKKGEKA